MAKLTAEVRVHIVSIDEMRTHEQAVIAALRRCRDGEDPDLVYAELYASAEHDYRSFE